VRLILKDSERRPDPTPVKTDDRKPLLIGIIAWVAALVIVLVVLQGFDATNVWLLWTCLTGIVLGGIALLYTRLRG
jgi:UDP-N-acetylmuramyl pentapeptide phosphotransferase/UDP-N-acetylglucosamine-1-phosphate transferase